MPREYTETIQSWELLTGKCSTCGSPDTVIRINSFRHYKNPRIVSGQQMHDYCAKHSPIDIEQTKRDWMEVLMTPPGAR